MINRTFIIISLLFIFLFTFETQNTEAQSTCDCNDPSAILGTTGDDIIDGTSGADIICSFEGNDTITGSGGGDCIDAGLGNDDVRGDGGADTIFGGEGVDILRGNGGADMVFGEEGDDDVRGGGGNDFVDGGSGTDVVRGGNGTDSCVNGETYFSCETIQHNLTVNKSGTGAGTVTSSPLGIDCGVDCTENYDENTEVTLSATPDSGSTFVGWSGDTDCTDGRVTMDAVKTCTAAFDLGSSQQFGLTINKAGLGTGTVTSSPVGINCGVDCTENYDENNVVTLTAIPDSGSTFVGWSGDADCTDGQVTMDAVKTCTATFDPSQQLSLTVNKTGTGTGTVTSSPTGIDCGPDCTENYDENTVVTITPTPDGGSIFVGWSGDSDCTNGQLVMNAAKTCIAIFSFVSQEQFNLIVFNSGSGSGTVTSIPSGIDCGMDCIQNYADREDVTLSVTPDSGSVFGGWEGDADCLDGVVEIDADTVINCTAIFNEGTSPCDCSNPNAIWGTSGDDVLNGTTGSDIICGFGGNDTIDGRPGGDCIDAGPGDDTVTAGTGEGNDTIFGGDGDDDLQGGFGDDFIDGGNGFDEIDGQSNNDICLNGEVFSLCEDRWYALTITKLGTGSGTVTSTPSGIDCGTDCIENYDNGEDITLSLTPDPGSVFGGWEGDADCSDGLVEINNAVINCNAIFNSRSGDNLSPSISIDQPSEPTIQETSPFIVVLYSDTESGVDTSTLQILLDSNDITSSCSISPSLAVCMTSALAQGLHTIDATINDISGNLGTDTHVFEIGQNDTTPPTISIDQPSDPIIADTTPDIVVSYSDTGSGVDTSTLQILLDTVDITSTCSVSASMATCMTSGLAQGLHTVDARINDVSGNLGTDTNTFEVDIGFGDTTPPTITHAILPVPNPAGWHNTNVTVTFTCSDAESGINFCTDTLVVDNDGADQDFAGVAIDNAGNGAGVEFILNIDKRAPVVEITSPEDQSATNNSQITINGTANDSVSGVVDIDCNGNSATLNLPNFSCEVVLTEGANTISVQATDAAGNTGSTDISINFLSIPIINITSPSDFSVVNSSPVSVTGNIQNTDTLSVNDVPVTINNGSFAVQIPLSEGLNTISAVGQNNSGNTSTSSIHVTLDTTPPVISITSPSDGFVANSDQITISGSINDIGGGGVGEPQVTVNNITANVLNGSFLVSNLSLSPGINTITAIGTDSQGNSSTESIEINFESITAQPKINLVSGNDQTAVIGSLLTEPFVVSLTDENNNPVPDQPVTFKILRSNGTLSNATNSGRTVTSITDSNGEAQVQMILGSRAGVGINQVEATAPGFTGNILFNATGLLTEPEIVSADSGNNQVGIVSQPLPLPLTVVVADQGGNRIPNVPVTFSVIEGGGNFEGNSEIIATSDSDGLARAVLTLGIEEGIGNNKVAANFQAATNIGTSFIASAVLPGNPAETRISGVVLDNSDIPMEGVTVSIEGTGLSTQTDAQGQFVINSAPIGKVLLLADGSTALRSGTWPTLEFELFTIAGIDNSLPMPIYLLPLDIANGIQVDENTGGTLTVPELPGFSLTVEPGSATFADGGKSGLISVTLVNMEKIPMTPNAGQQPRFIITIQPPGVHFDPPAPITYPNVDGFSPGEIVELYSFDHDLGRFVTIGTGSVSDDGTIIKSDPGSGIIEGGWHCGGLLQFLGLCCKCPECKFCAFVPPPLLGGLCLPNPLEIGSQCGGDSCLECTLLGNCEPKECPDCRTCVDGNCDPDLTDNGFFCLETDCGECLDGECVSMCNECQECDLGLDCITDSDKDQKPCSNPPAACPNPDFGPICDDGSCVCPDCSQPETPPLPLENCIPSDLANPVLCEVLVDTTRNQFCELMFQCCFVTCVDLCMEDMNAPGFNPCEITCLQIRTECTSLGACPFSL